MSNRSLYTLVAILVACALLMVGYKVLVLQFPLLPDTEVDAWDIEVGLSFVAQGGPVKVTLYQPRQGSPYAIVDERFVSQGFGFSSRRVDGNRQVVWSARNLRGEQFLYYRATARTGEATAAAMRAPPERDDPGFTGAELIAASAVLAEVRAHSADAETLVVEVIRRLASGAEDGNVGVLLGAVPSRLRRQQVAARLLVAGGVPARVVHGVRLETLARSAAIGHWLEAYYDDNWHAFDGQSGEPGAPEGWLAWWHGTAPLVRVTGAERVQTQISVGINKESALVGATRREQMATPALFDYSLLSLPVDTQAVYHVLLTVPLGVLVLVVMRNVVGVKTFGTFMPVLIALAFRETRLLWGIVLFSLVVGLGLFIRFHLERMKLLLVPRLAAVLIVVIILMALISILSQQLGFYRGLSVALFPMVIMTMTIERMSIVWEERGRGEALQQGLGSLLVAALAYLTMSIPLMQHVIFVFPELLLLLLAVVLLLGRYTGYRLSELLRFRSLGKPAQ
ncbi:MAG: hypothetical protein AMJ69_02795 [Gammaproteobacteria bacterium SG8_47]|nr:MAG: hypothetical protein AMJ69_02795 [Gammaproteobacteria bacterium SG8_47]